MARGRGTSEGEEEVRWKEEMERNVVMFPREEKVKFLKLISFSEF